MLDLIKSSSFASSRENDETRCWMCDWYLTVGWPSHMTQTSVVTSESLMSLMIGRFIISKNISV